jgi:protein-S-isoprenylcysteine O-methyltransferase Ste14
MAVVFFLSAGTFAYWEAWAFIVVLFVPLTLALVYLLRHDLALLERRLRARERQADQNFIIKLAMVSYVFAFLLPGFDRRFGWSDVPVTMVIVADAVFLLAYGLFFLVLRENSYASRVVEIERGQKVVCTGPYAIVRHPMYVAVLGMLLASPVALGSWWALVPALPMAPLIVLRIRGEERLLARQLDGYQTYMKTTRYRLLPGVW